MAQQVLTSAKRKLRMKKNSIEVLSPAGDFESVIAAVQNGADAVYLGQKSFSARQNAQNFDKDDLEQAVQYCHVRGVFVYLAFNTLVSDSQLFEARQAIEQACEIGVDAIIVQDLGVLSLVSQMLSKDSKMHIHASTQMAVHTVKGAALLKRLGVTRVVLARELTLHEIEKIVKSVDIETEVFVHGALCMSVSGQCYMSGMIGTRSGNRGNCAGTCRLPFSSSGDRSAYDLSLKDLCLAEHIQKLIDIGVTSLKIEGRMKRPEYAAVTAKAYDDARNGLMPDIAAVKAVFSRSGFTDGYLTGRVDGDMFGYRSKGDVVAATAKILKQLANTYKKENPHIGVDFTFKALRNQPTRLVGVDEDGNTASAEGGAPEQAIKAAMSKESVEKSLSRLGGTIFYMKSLNAAIDEGIVVSAAALNELRRCVSEELLHQRKAILPVEYCTVEIPQFTARHSEAAMEKAVRVRYRAVSQIDMAAAELLDAIILPMDEVWSNAAMLSPIAEKIFIEPYRVMFSISENDDCEAHVEEKLRELYGLGFTHLVAENIAHIELGTEIGYTLHGGAYLNCFNSLSAKLLADVGICDITLSFELETARANKIASEKPLGQIVYGQLPLMIMKNCPLKAKRGCTGCDGCRQGDAMSDSGNNMLTDRLGIRFPVICNKKRYTEILNSNRLYMGDRKKELTAIDFAVLYFTIESQQECSRVLECYRNGSAPEFNHTRGLYYRSI